MTTTIFFFLLWNSFVVTSVIYFSLLILMVSTNLDDITRIKMLNKRSFFKEVSILYLVILVIVTMIEY